MDELFKEEGYQLMGAAFEVYNELGSGFLEEVYQESLEKELTNRGIAFLSKSKLPITYKGAVLKKSYEADLIVEEGIIVESFCKLLIR